MKGRLTQTKLKKMLHYNPDTGLFTWLINNRNEINIGDIAGCLNKITGYIIIGINGKIYQAHRLSWLYMHGYFPEYKIDHKNGKGDDNRWVNLRHVTHSCNMQNQKINKRNTSGFPGIKWSKSEKRWRSQLTVNKRTIYLGLYTNILEAALARFTEEVWCPDWTCNYRSELAKAIKNAWPEFNPKQ